MNAQVETLLPVCIAGFDQKGTEKTLHQSRCRGNHGWPCGVIPQGWQLGADLRMRGEDGTGQREDFAGLAGGFKPVARAVKQRNAQLAFQPFQLRTDAWLRDAEQACGFGRRPDPHQRSEEFHFTQVHYQLSNRYPSIYHYSYASPLSNLNSGLQMRLPLVCLGRRRAGG